MNALLRKLRGVIGIGLTWGILWATIGAATAFIIRVTIPGSMDPGENECRGVGGDRAQSRASRFGATEAPDRYTVAWTG